MNRGVPMATVGKGRKTIEDREQMSALDRLRHSAAHVMAAAVCRLYDGVQLDIGPATEDGFYYDFGLDQTFSPEDLEKIEAEMARIIGEDQPFERSVLSRQEAEAVLKEKGQGYKLDRLGDIPEDEPVTIYRNGDFMDLCAGPHVERTGAIKAFKLLSVAGSYFRGDEKNPMLQRIYGTAFPSKGELKQYLERIEEAKRRDHRKLGRELELFMFSPRVGSGLPLWLPKGAILRQTLEDFLKQEQTKRGYLPVVTPHLAKIDLYERSGHWGHYQDSMYAPIQVDDEQYILRPMNCPHHIEIYNSKPRSYRDLPVRLAEFGMVYRYEQSGELSGLTRVRGFTIDDAHIFLLPEQLKEEFKAVIDLILHVFHTLGFDQYQARLSLRDPEDKVKYVGSDEVWDRAETAIREAVQEKGLDAEIGVGEAAFYGPKLDFMVADALGRQWQLGTVQVDYNLPERFELEYIGDDGQRHRPVMLHRAPFGSIDRLTAVLIENFAGAFPLWLSPEQVRVIPITKDQHAFASEVEAELQAAGIRVTVDARNEKMGAKIREARLQRIPYMAVIGAREVEAGAVAVRSRAGDEGAMELKAFADRLKVEIEQRLMS
ncbi:MAG TPA: threonine--tRNA ligase [Verrucomicrobia bacterium]|nr:threonine--tRNA ligase [Verrucomicrobiota bacterium]